ncbi:MAG: YkgJ family cysteine cluster protein [Methylorubrum extorquens]|jgi:hypothetical protein|nr:YkgJ family cysteine cluster protein [Methylorubrum extorquens]MCG5248744.1 YkgJ family cysteine cluster protein [Methylorubrum extorquens]
MPKISRLLCLSAIRVHYPSAYVIALALILGLIGFGSASAGIPAERQMTITLAELQGELRDGSRGSSCCPCCFLHETSPSRGACSCGLDFDAASVCAEPHLLASRPHFPSHAQAFSSADLTKSSKPPRTRYDSVCNLQAKTQIIRQNDGYVSRLTMKAPARGRRLKRRQPNEHTFSPARHLVQVPLPVGMPAIMNPLVYEAATSIARSVRDNGLARCHTVERVASRRVEVLLDYLENEVFTQGDAAVDGLIADAPGGRLQVACRKGCSWCCYQDVEVSIPEAILVARMRAAGSEFAGRLSGLPSDSSTSTGVSGQGRAGLPCPLLGAGKSCSVYAVRPFACRTLLSSDALRCEEALKSAASGRDDVSTKSYGIIQLIGCAHRAGINAIAKELGLQHDDVSLVSALSQINDDKGIINRWIEGGRVFKPRSGS